MLSGNTKSFCFDSGMSWVSSVLIGDDCCLSETFLGKSPHSLSLSHFFQKDKESVTNVYIWDGLPKKFKLHVTPVIFVTINFYHRCVLHHFLCMLATPRTSRYIDVFACLFDFICLSYFCKSSFSDASL